MKQLILGDVHHPFSKQELLDKVYEVAVKIKPDAIVQIGDLYDMYSFSKFPRNPNFITPEDEIDLGRGHADEMWKSLHDAAPRADLVQLYGNHDLRPVKMVATDAPMTLSIMKKWLKEMMSFKGVKTVLPEHEIDGVMYTHGDNFRRPGDQARYNQQNSVIGHTHCPNITYMRNKLGPFWEMNVGWLGDDESEVFSYRAQKKIQRMIHGYGIIEDGQPRVVLL